MLKFFRRIRKRLLETGKIRSYSLYAIGEIALVVIGILIALQINNWNEARKAKVLTQSLLLSLQEDLELDLEILDTYKALLETREKSGFNVWNYLYENGIKVDTSGLDKDFLGLHLFNEFSPRTTAYDNLLSSGGIIILQDTELPKLLATLFREDDFEIRAQAQRGRLTNDYDPFRIKYITPLMLRDYLSELLLDQPDYENKGHKVEWENLKKDQGYKDLLHQILAMQVPARNRLRLRSAQIEAILVEINSLTMLE